MKSFKKSVISLVAAASLGMSVFSSSYVFALDNVYTNDSDVPDTSVEVVWDMGNGINLGNTMEACGDWINGSSPQDFETAWGQPLTTKAIIEGMKEAGFDSVRIPVAWSNMMSKDDYTIDPAYLDRVEQIVKWVLEADMYAVVNEHWDGGSDGGHVWWEDFSSKDETLKKEAWKRYEAIWTQVGERFKDYSHKLILESANEELGSSFNGIREVQKYELITQVNQKFVDIIRSQGSKNADRFLLIAGYNTNIDKTIDDRYIMPTDTVKDHLMISVHYYDPADYCLVDNPTNSWGYSDTWGTESDIEYMKNQLAKMKQYSRRGYGVIIGECGVSKQRYKENGASIDPVVKNGTYEWYDHMLKFCEEYNFCPVSWDCSDWYIRRELKVTDEKMAKVFKDNEFDPQTSPKPFLGTTVSGTVKAPGTDNTPVDVTIIDNNSGFVVYKTTSDSDMTYTVENVVQGEYTAIFEKDNCVIRGYDLIVGDEAVVLDAELHIKGDVNGDGDITTSDVGLTNACAVGTSELSLYDSLVADMTEDGELTTRDVGLINAIAVSKAG